MNETCMAKKTGERDPYFDNMKAVLIFLVVLGHCLSSFNEVGGSGYNWLYQVIFSFHMPVFLFVSGYFASPKPKKTIAKLLPLYLVFQIAHVFLQYLEDWLLNPKEAVFDFQLFDPQWTLWYLMVLMIYALVLPLFNVDDRRKQIRNLTAAFACGLLIGLNNEIHNFMDISRAISFLPFFLLGYYAKKNGDMVSWLMELQAAARGTGRRPESECARTKKKQAECGKRRFLKEAEAGGATAREKRFHMVILRVSAIVGAAILLIFFSLPECPYRGEMFYGTMSYKVDGFSVGIKIQTYLVSLAWLLVLLILIPNRKIPLLGKIGRNTLGVYLFHTIAIRILRMNPLTNSLLNQSFLLMFAVSIGLTLLFSMDCFSGLLKRVQSIHVRHISKKTIVAEGGERPALPAPESLPDRKMAAAERDAR